MAKLVLQYENKKVKNKEETLMKNKDKFVFTLQEKIIISSSRNKYNVYRTIIIKTTCRVTYCCDHYQQKFTINFQSFNIVLLLFKCI